MKIRNGFVSNSSASSFTIYGWSLRELSKHMIEIMPIFEGADLNIEAYDFEDNIKKLCPDLKLDITYSQDSNYDTIIGIGRAEGEIDHYISDGLKWEDIEYDEPVKEDREELDAIAKEINLPKPKMYKETFFEG